MKKTSMLSQLALAGIISGLACAASAKTAKNEPADSSTAGSNSMMNNYKHGCRGQNSCKGQGGCRMSVADQKAAAKKMGACCDHLGPSHSCKGQNSCKGMGGCNTMMMHDSSMMGGKSMMDSCKHSCKGQNSCKGQGGCNTK